MATSLKLDNCFDRIVCVTLDKRLVKQETSVKYECAAFGGTVQPFVVGDGIILPDHFYDYIDINMEPRRQAYNYACVLLQILRKAKNNLVQRLFYLEDDAALTTKFQSIFPQAWQELDELREPWDMLYIGGNHVNGKVERLTKHIIRPDYSLDLHAVVFAHSAFDKLLDIEPSAHHTIDGVIAGRQRQGLLKVLALSPSVIVQRPGWSYNENRHDNKMDRYEL